MKAILLGVGSLLIVPILALGVASGKAVETPAAPVSPNGFPVSGELAAAVLSHPSIHLRPAARRDVEAGLVDPRVLEVLLLIARFHTLGAVGPFVTGHSYFVAGTGRVSNHAFGRAVDIPVVDGRPVSVTNGEAFDVAGIIGSLPSPLRPSELGAPWELEVEGLRSFRLGHSDHLHYGFDESVPGGTLMPGQKARPSAG